MDEAKVTSLVGKQVWLTIRKHNGGVVTSDIDYADQWGVKLEAFDPVSWKDIDRIEVEVRDA